MPRLRRAPVRDAILCELAAAVRTGVGGAELRARLRRQGTAHATSGFYQALEALAADGFVRGPRANDGRDPVEMIGEVADALADGDGLARPMSFASDGYVLTEAGTIAAQIALARRALAAGKRAQVDDHLLRIQRDLARRRAS